MSNVIEKENAPNGAAPITIPDIAEKENVDDENSKENQVKRLKKFEAMLQKHSKNLTVLALKLQKIWLISTKYLFLT